MRDIRLDVDTELGLFRNWAHHSLELYIRVVDFFPHVSHIGWSDRLSSFTFELLLNDK